MQRCTLWGLLAVLWVHSFGGSNTGPVGPIHDSNPIGVSALSGPQNFPSTDTLVVGVHRISRLKDSMPHLLQTIAEQCVNGSNGLHFADMMEFSAAQHTDSVLNVLQPVPAFRVSLTSHTRTQHENCSTAASDSCVFQKCRSLHHDFLLYNRIPKSGSTTMIRLFEVRNSIVLHYVMTEHNPNTLIQVIRLYSQLLVNKTSHQPDDADFQLTASMESKFPLTFLNSKHYLLLEPFKQGTNHTQVLCAFPTILNAVFPVFDHRVCDMTGVGGTSSICQSQQSKNVSVRCQY